MNRSILIIVFIALGVLLSTFCISSGKEDSLKGAGNSTERLRNACDLMTKAEVEKISGVAIVNVVLRDRGTFTSCSFETDNWESTTGVIYYPGLKSVESSAALAEEIRKDIERDQAPFGIPEPVDGITDAAAYYASNDGYLHIIVAQKGGDRIIISAKSRTAATEMAKAALTVI
ncbi:MAG: hypothetical protein OEM01_00350 [Desulfobulbaceae bacterium]|nr:hypothetical protein [Desulfobulbaceae bacterium]